MLGRIITGEVPSAREERASVPLNVDAAIAKALPVMKKRALYIVKEATPNLKRASRNLRERIEVRTAAEFSAYDVMQREKLVIDEAAIETIEKRLAVPAKEKSHEA